jgi:hypothetical protein
MARLAVLGVVAPVAMLYALSGGFHPFLYFRF